MLSEDERRLRDKRRRLVKVITDLRKDQLRFLASHPEMDVNRAQLERTSSRSDIERIVDKMDEPHVDDLLAFHDPVGSGQRRYVW